MGFRWIWRILWWHRGRVCEPHWASSAPLALAECPKILFEMLSAPCPKDKTPLTLWGQRKSKASCETEEKSVDLVTPELRMWRAECEMLSLLPPPCWLCLQLENVLVNACQTLALLKKHSYCLPGHWPSPGQVWMLAARLIQIFLKKQSKGTIKSLQIIHNTLEGTTSGVSRLLQFVGLKQFF